MRPETKKTKRTGNQKKDAKKIESPKGLVPLPEEEGRTREFLFATFHDMKNPLQAIIGYTSLVLRKTRDQIPKIHQDNLEKVLQSAEKLNEMVERMVAYYRGK